LLEEFASIFFTDLKLLQKHLTDLSSKRLPDPNNI